jgi:hypothetical protein
LADKQDSIGKYANLSFWEYTPFPTIILFPKISTISSMYYFDVDSLSELSSKNMAARVDEAHRACEIINSKVDEFSKWQNESTQGKLVKTLFEHIEILGQNETNRTLKKIELNPNVVNKTKLEEERFQWQLINIVSPLLLLLLGAGLFHQWRKTAYQKK